MIRSAFLSRECNYMIIYTAAVKTILCRTLALLLLLSLPLTSQAQFSSVEDELAPHPELGPRSLDDLSDEAYAIRSEELLQESNRVMAPVPRVVKRRLFDLMAGVSMFSMRDMFNFMTSKVKVAEDITFDEVIESMEIRANAINFKKVGHNEFWRDVSAISGLATTRVEVLQFCDAMVGRRMLDYSPEFVVFIPCRIAVYQDANGEIWIMTLDWDVSWLATAWHPDSQLDEQLKQDAIRIRDAMTEIMMAGAEGDF